MLDAATLSNELSNFNGTDAYSRWSVLYPQFVLTDGALFLAENARCYWLMDIIGSYQGMLQKKQEDFQVWTLKVAENKTAVVTCDDGNGHVLCSQKVPFTDFPLPAIKLYAIYDSPVHLVILLPSEY